MRLGWNRIYDRARADLMDVEEKRTTSPCKRLHELPAVSTDWQQTTWYPDCEYYDRGTCGYPTRTDTNTACPLEGKPLPLRIIATESNDEQPHKPLSTARTRREEKSTALEQTIKRQIMSRTGDRIQSLKVQQTGREVVIRGSAPSYYVKQLALHGVLDVIRSADKTDVEVNVQVVVCSATAKPDPR
jgi:hypothetical protein